MEACVMAARVVKPQPARLLVRMPIGSGGLVVAVPLMRVSLVTMVRYLVRYLSIIFGNNLNTLPYHLPIPTRRYTSIWYKC